jgi:hypothetical protein
VTNPASSPVPVSGSIAVTGTSNVNITNTSVPVTGTVNAQQAGTWTVGLGAGSEKLDAANTLLTSLKALLSRLSFDNAGNLLVNPQGPAASGPPVASKQFSCDGRLDPFGDQTCPVMVNGLAATINVSHIALLAGHDNLTVMLTGPGVFRQPVIINSQDTTATFPQRIPTNSILVICDNATEHCDFDVSVIGD